ncbi:cell wall metabolism sensor histidine kinase WalK [Fulvivirgaceae bacterium PWU4]|uniref:histidine kinase n=1 Tax=Chryseosolibacter histidini TaxID=2782349 RepID=A0AAP2DPH9_9BACT|nr:ATP-binding protein [Chryseosolibacter histidini]MBT1698837.1 cell wall metabolism sensor histidine kinase WalK [Chryseosolibacter histidini]
MSIKTKVALGVAFLFIVIVTVGGMGLYYLKALTSDSKNILTDNYETLEYTKRIIEVCDSLGTDSTRALGAIESNLRRQEDNVTEAGERELTHRLRVAFERLKNTGIADSCIVRIRNICLAIQDLNMQAIIRKNEVTQNTAHDATTYLIIIGTICTLAAFTFIINFPGYIANPIMQLTRSIKSIANKDYEERLHFDRKDEFEELAEAFNQMAEKLDEYEHSNLAKILFEKKRIETIINRMNDPVIGLDEHDKVVFANDQALSLLHLTSRDVLNHYAPDIAVNNDLFRSLIRENAGAHESTLIKAIVGGKENYFSRESINISHTPTGEKDAVKIGQVILLKNITPYKELDLAKTNFIATISHELKTPIASLQMCSRLLNDARIGSLNDEQRNIVSTLEDEIVRLSKITNELLDLSQVETGNIRLNIRKADPKDILTMAVEAVKFHAERKHVAIEVQAAGDLPPIQADVDKTTWVLVNFLTNAIRYSPENERIILSCDHSNGAISFSVEDHGPGIEEKYLNRIFEKFFQVPGTPSGTGLGLAISKEFIEAQQGEIGVTSEVGKGSRFTFRLPVG